MDIVEKIPNLRKVSITPWADVNVAWGDDLGLVDVSKSVPYHSQTGSIVTRLPWARSLSARRGTMVARGRTPRCLKLI
jgi:hypothetical protein